MSRFEGIRKMFWESFNTKTSWTIKDIPDLTGKVVIITGGNSGIGFETTKRLLQKNATVYIGARSLLRGNEAAEELRDETGNSKVYVLEMDLADLRTLPKAVEEFESREKRLDILYNNAGLMQPPMDQLTVQGYDLQFGVHVIGHYYLTKLLIPILTRTASSLPPTDPVRVIDISSDGHLLNGNTGSNLINFSTVVPGDARTRAGVIQMYLQSKSGNLILSKARSRLLKDQNVISISVHPGRIRSNLQKFSNTFFGKLFFSSTELGAITSLYVGTSPEAAHKNGKYFIPYAREMLPRSDHTNNSEAEDKLVAWLEEQLKAHNLR